jgi:hypothetical protein
LPLRELVDQWRAEAQILQDNGASGQATVKLRDADELECALRQWGRERLTLDAAAKESGYSYPFAKAPFRTWEPKDDLAFAVVTFRVSRAFPTILARNPMLRVRSFCASTRTLRGER